MRKLTRREKGLLGLLAVAALAVGAWALRQSGAAPAVLGRARAERPLPPVPRIDLARTEQPRANATGEGRDLFEFGSGAPGLALEAQERAPAVPVAPAPAPGATVGAPVPASIPGQPPLSLKYIGSVENKAGVKVAVLLTDRREVLTGQPGQVVANRYRIARIGIESVDLEDVASGQSRRIPLRGN